ncbi:DUF3427 domain-containing protein [Alkalicoccus chagannorensis]|uniref:DUF3427 domain-containing protein n=1 Tax=Alkalicoccus chagannorensis TaxID=427072 RepID=UPI0004001821|nr:DEAD/DEAH box helicase [Alkalicoccus chagannorensis]
MESIIGQMKHSLEKGFIDRHHTESSRFKPELLINDKRANQHVLTSLVDELVASRSFLFSVAFITESGLATLKSQLLDLHHQGVHGNILTSTYQQFNQPKVFRELQKLKNVEVRISDIEAFHSKGYIFEHDEYHSMIIGSSNLTASALKVNYEWNVKLNSHENGEIVYHFREQFHDMWEKATPLTDAWIAAYSANYKPFWQDRVAEMPAPYDTNPPEKAVQIEPNNMQLAALQGITGVRDRMEDRALVISATGTGKTYLAAFDVRRFRPRKMLFTAHREQILHKAKEAFQDVLGGADDDFGIVAGSRRETDARYVFATVQTLTQPDTLQQFQPETFDYILIDESHRAGAATYQRLLDHFDPQFLLGMTATPERTDGYDLFQLFHYNLAYEIRLQEALEEDMLAPFHYFGVTDLEVEGENKRPTFSRLISDERVDRIVDKMTYYGHAGERLCGLMFCSSKKEAEALSEALNARGFRTKALTGEDPQDVRKREVERLEQGELDYLVTVDIFNEGIDIPALNQIVMLRATASSIVFVQQLGRGLRKHREKPFVTVIDFVANYSTNYVIPIALSGDRSQNKEEVRRKMIDQSYLQGTSTINFEAVAKERIYRSINSAKMNDLPALKEAYRYVKNRIGRPPLLYDFIDHHSLDPVVIASKKAHYGLFLEAMREEAPALDGQDAYVLRLLTQELLSGKRLQEIVLLEMLLANGEVTEAAFIEQLQEEGLPHHDAVRRSVRRVLTLAFFVEKEREKYGDTPLLTFHQGRYELTDMMKERRKHPDFMKLAEDVLRTARRRGERYDQQVPFTRFEKYTRKDACRLLNWDNNEQATIYGYKTKHGSCPIFTTYEKHEVAESVDYDDRFLNPEVFHWYTRSRRTTASAEVKEIIEAPERDIDLHLFVKKNDDEGRDFYYMGALLPDKQSVVDTTMPGEETIPVVTMNFLLEQKLDQQMYDYLHE